MTPDSESQPKPAGPQPDETTLVCHCMVVEAGKIRTAIEAGAHTIEAVQDATYASTGCGTCRFDIQLLLRQAGHPGDDHPDT